MPLGRDVYNVDILPILCYICEQTIDIEWVKVVGRTDTSDHLYKL